ncbi:hypothetical protein F5J12DRAFT_782106 [Pisolithus orientalis]|uniref:uncharacterized protein n=1 Tax=Pisolithus orientalis TaxID=936130 RepID=UPI0022254C21|nr:uncharacterized protein F5J12DRAFT_782106 [Pisolithus orientalis]KAI6009598.1 hypothetical protein F5J12DRAFT_782106 [Pisolithus orientalis]
MMEESTERGTREDSENPLNQVYVEGRMPSMRELDKDILLNPWVALAAMNEFLENIWQQWRDYGFGPKSFHNHRIDPVKNLKDQTSRASSPDTRAAEKREEEGYPQGKAIVPQLEVEAIGAVLPLACQTDQCTVTDKTVAMLVMLFFMGSYDTYTIGKGNFQLSRTLRCIATLLSLTGEIVKSDLVMGLRV